jgi:pyridoxal phosphate enzyme (YggS family)
MSIANNIAHIQRCIHEAEVLSHRPASSVQLLAVSKTRNVAEITEAIDAGQTHFGENYYQEALTKIQMLQAYSLTWHFIGPIQSNKTKGIATHFSWLHSLSKLKIATQLNQHRPLHLPPLNICIQMNLDHEPSKSGLFEDELLSFVNHLTALPRLQLRGLMMIPKPEENSALNYEKFLHLSDLKNKINQTFNLDLDTLSMGMSDDLTEAIRAGSTLVRIGRGIFGERL